MLEVSEIDVHYGEAQAIDQVSLNVAADEIVAVLGSNGAGKTTVVNAIAGIHPLSAGMISCDGQVISELPTYRVVEHGVAVVPEGRRLFPAMTILENLELGAYSRSARAHLRESLSWVFNLFPILAERRWQRAGSLSGGQQQMLALGRALMARPRYLLMDEPSLGLAPIIVDQLFNLIDAIHQAGLGILIVEQNVERTLDLCQRGYVLEEGRMIMQGSREDLLASARVRQAYLSL
jgi:branched-chain amino acid transport system ATP-binding protein